MNLTPEVGVTLDGGVGGDNLDTRAISALQVGVVVVGMNVTLANQANSPTNEWSWMANGYEAHQNCPNCCSEIKKIIGHF